MSADGLHSAGELRMESTLAAANAAEGSGAFFSLRFGAEHGVLPMAEQLLAALRERGASGMIVNMAAGRDIDTTVFAGIESCGTFLVFGSAKYGEDTGNQACTYYEYKHAFAKKKRIVLVRMIPFEQEFENLQARVIFNANRLVLPWMVGTPMPADLPDKIIEAMGLPAGAAPEPSPQLAGGSGVLGMPPSMASPTPSETSSNAAAEVYEAASTVEAMLAKVRLSTYSTVFSSEGYEFVVDLLEADPADLEELMTMCGMKKPERKRFERALAMKGKADAEAEVTALTGVQLETVGKQSDIGLEIQLEPEPPTGNPSGQDMAAVDAALDARRRRIEDQKDKLLSQRQRMGDALVSAQQHLESQGMAANSLQPSPDAQHETVLSRAAGETYSNEIATLRAQASELQTQLTQRSDETRKSEQQLKETQQELLAAQQASESAQQQLTGMRAEMATAKEAHRTEISRLQGDHRTERDQLQSRLDDATSALNAADTGSQVSELQDQLSAAQQASESAQQQLTGMRAEMATAKEGEQPVRASSAAVDETGDVNEPERMEAQPAETALQKEEQLKKAAAEGEQLQESQPADGATLQSKIDEQAAHIERLTRELALSRESPASPGVTVATRATIESQAEQIIELQRQIADQRDAERFLEARAATLQSKIDAHDALMAEKQQEVDDLFAEINGRDARLYELEQAQANLTAVLDLKAAKAELTAAEEEKQIEMAMLEEEKADAEAKVRDLTGELAAKAGGVSQDLYDKAVSDLEAAKAELTAAEEEKEIEMAMLEEEKADAEAKVRDLTAELAEVD
eukprot:COSAG02_NODE_7468_length_2998_cov_6.109003_1_plen_804_part_10